MPVLPNNVVIGIDPGIMGGIAMIGPMGGVTISQMPATDLDLWKILKGHGGSIAYIEEVATTPQMGVVSAGTFMMGFGKLVMALTAAGIRFQLIKPKAWQKGLNIRPRDTTKLKKMVVNKKGKSVEKLVDVEPQAMYKKHLLKIAQRLFPKLEVWNATLGFQLAVCDALLIAEYCRRTNR